MVNSTDGDSSEGFNDVINCYTTCYVLGVASVVAILMVGLVAHGLNISLVSTVDVMRWESHRFIDLASRYLLISLKRAITITSRKSLKLKVGIPLSTCLL